MADVAPPAENVNGVFTEQQATQIPDDQKPAIICVRNLNYTVTDEELKEFFAPVGEHIEACNVEMRGTRPAGYGFVTVKDRAVAEQAIAELNDKELKERKVIVELAKDPETKKKDLEDKRARRVNRRGSKPPRGEVTEEEANGEAAPAGAEGQAEQPKKAKKKKRNTAKKVKDTVAEALGADGSAANAESSGEKAPKKKRTPRPRRAEGEEPTGEPSKESVFVANLPFSVKDADLAALFTEKGINVVETRVVLTRWGRRRSKGYAFVNVGNPEEQEKAIGALHGYEIDDGKGNKRAIAVKVAVDGQSEREEDKENAEPAAAAAEEVSAAA